MNINETKPKKLKWQSGEVTISLSIQHHDMHIVEHADGTFHNVTASNSYMLAKYPPTNGK
jgi:hypothetical protein